MSQPTTLKKPSRLKFYIIFLIMAVLYVLSWIGVKGNIRDLIAGWPNIVEMMSQLFPPDWGYFQTILKPMLETVKMAILGTTLGAIIGIPFTLLASRNVFKNKWVSGITRTIMNLTRTLPDLLLASVFVAAVGIGPLAGVGALTVFSFGIVTKLAYEAVETIDPGPLEAMTAVGANKLQFIRYAVVPQALPSFVAFVLYTFEVCVRASAILGLVGAGGIGMELQAALDNFLYNQVALIILFTLVIVIVIDTVSATIREKLL